MHRLKHIILLVGLLLLSTFTMDSNTSPFYTRSSLADDIDMAQLMTLDSDSLFRRGFRYIASNPIQTDSALMCYSIVIGREKQARGDSAAMAPVIKSLINTSFIYTYVFNDMVGSYMLLRQAEELCNEYGIRYILAHIYLNLSEAFSTNERIYGKSFSPDVEKESLSYLKKAFDIAESTGNDEAMVFAMYNMLNVCLDEDDDMLEEYAHRFLNSDVPKTHDDYPFLHSLCVGLLALQSNQFDEALSQFENILEYETKVPALNMRMTNYAKYM